MEITQTTPATASGAAPAAAKPRINSDFDTFLRMLTAQMKNQDPLNPIESADFATQLATFSSVEQAVTTNDLLRGMMSQTGLADMAGWVGKDARSAAPVYFDGATPMTLYPAPMGNAETGEIVVSDANGDIVQRFAAPVSGEALQWTGALPTEAPLPAGVYQFSYINRRQGEVIGDTSVELYAQVTEVRSVDGAKQLIMNGGIAVPVSDVIALRDAP